MSTENRFISGLDSDLTNLTEDIQNVSYFVSRYLSGNSSNYSGSLENDYYDYYYYYYDQPLTMGTKEWQVPIFSYFYPGIALLTILVNILVVYVFARRKMRSQTTFMLSVLACSDSVICFAVAVYHIYFHLLENYKHPLEFRWCIMKHFLHVLEDTARCVSNWITALLGIQRFICICFPFKARILCSLKVSVISSVGIVLVAISTYMYEAVSVKITPLPVMNGSTQLFESCVQRGGSRSAVIASYIGIGVIAKILPCSILLITTILLARKLCQRQQGIAGNVNDGRKSSTKMERLNVLVFIILVLFLLSELQDAIVFSIYVYELSKNKPREVLSKEIDEAWDTWGCLISLLNYHCNFWIFFLMSTQFRSAFYETCSSARKHKQPSSTRETLLSTSTSSGANKSLRIRQ